MTKPIRFTRGKQRFEVRHEPMLPHFAYVGYVNGTRSITAMNPDSAVRTLIKKHVARIPAATVIDLAAVRRAKGLDQDSIY